jgi:8-oxo-dGTP pyrophosphatase MutT (NUDIX family)
VVVIVPVKRAADDTRVLGLPKGHLDPGESAREAARREVREETGVTAELVDALGEIHYEFERRGRLISKTVVFFLFEYQSGSIEDHDREIEEALWMPIARAIDALTYDGEREMVARALSRITRAR